uniref:Uncharacterized protein n=1 Tax=viral metagenome TaxID=1070528 RepID=A0A6H1ZZW7_9ZZZZ
MEVKIEDIREITSLTPDGEFFKELRVKYRTKKGYVGEVVVPKIGATEKVIEEAVLSDAEQIEKLIGSTLKGK